MRGNDVVLKTDEKVKT